MSYRIGNALHTLGDVGQVVLLKLRVRCKQDDRLPFPVFVMQRPRQARVCPFRHTRRVAYARSAIRAASMAAARKSS